MPAAAASTRHDLSLFLPNRQLHLQPGNHRIRLLVEVSTGRSIEPLVRHQTDLFTINSPGWSRSTLVDILNERFHAVGNTYIGSAIPERKLTAVQSLHAASLKRGESICLIYDGTVFGSAKDGFAITTAGVAWKENIGCDPGYATFNQLSPETIVADDSYLNMCGLGKGYVYPSDVSAAESALRGVLADIQVARKKSGNTAP